MTDLPGSWAEVYDRLSYALADRASAREWVRQALEATWGVQDPAELERGRRGIALQRLSGVLLALEDETQIAIMVGQRGLVAGVFSRYFDGMVLPGPPWRLDPYEDLPTRDVWVRSSDFDTVEVIP